MQSDALARERRPLVGQRSARRRRAARRTPRSEVVPSRPGPRRSASSGRLRGTRLSLRSAQRCRPEVGVPVRTAPSRTGNRLGSAPPRPSGAAVPTIGREKSAASPTGGGVPVRTAPSRTGWGLRRRGPPGRCADRRSAFPEPSPRFNADRRYAVRSSEIRGAQRCWCGFRAPARCRSETGAPCPRDSARGGVLTSAKTMAANFVRCQRDRGESVKGGLPPPFHESTMTNRNSPPRAEGAQGSFDSRRRSGWASGPPTPAICSGVPCRSRRTSEGRRGGPGMGAYRSQSAGDRSTLPRPGPGSGLSLRAPPAGSPV